MGLAWVSNTEVSVEVDVRLLWHFTYMSSISACGMEASSRQSVPEVLKGLTTIFLSSVA